MYLVFLYHISVPCCLYFPLRLRPFMTSPYARSGEISQALQDSHKRLGNVTSRSATSLTGAEREAKEHAAQHADSYRVSPKAPMGGSLKTNTEKKETAINTTRRCKHTCKEQKKNAAIPAARLRRIRRPLSPLTFHNASIPAKTRVCAATHVVNDIFFLPVFPKIVPHMYPKGILLPM